MGILDHPRYKDNPVALFFEEYVLDTIGLVPPERHRELDELNLQRVFGTKASGWREVIEETLHLSDTLPLAILDLWFRNRAAIGEPRAFAMEFVDRYLAEDSKVDVWPEGGTDAARRVIGATPEGAALLARIPPPRKPLGFWSRLLRRSR